MVIKFVQNEEENTVIKIPSDVANQILNGFAKSHNMKEVRQILTKSSSCSLLDHDLKNCSDCFL